MITFASISSCVAVLLLGMSASFAQERAVSDGSVLPFAQPPSKSVAGPTLRESKLAPFPAESHLPKDAPNILIIMLDDVGFGLPDTFGGPIHTPTLSRLANEGISYNTFHTTS